MLCDIVEGPIKQKQMFYVDIIDGLFSSFLRLRNVSGYFLYKINRVKFDFSLSGNN